jgi:hypothetical protein
VPKHIARGENVWSNVHIDDLVERYLLALDKAPPGASTTSRTAGTRCARRAGRSAACWGLASAPSR